MLNLLTYLHFAISRDISAEVMLLPSLSHSFLWLPLSFKQSQTVTLSPHPANKREANIRALKIVFTFFIFYNYIFPTHLAFRLAPCFLEVVARLNFEQHKCKKKLFAFMCYTSTF